MQHIADAALKAQERGGRAKAVLLALFVAVLLMVSILFGVILGSSGLTVKAVADVLKTKLLGVQGVNIPSSAVYIVWNLRLPRALLAVAAGGGLAVCGAAMQAMTQNALADPYILGVSSGALTMVSLSYFFGGVFISSQFLLRSSAFLGALIAMAVVYGIGAAGGKASNTRLVLAGMAVTIVFNAVSQLFITLSGEKALRSVYMWMMGSLAEARWDNVALPLAAAFAGFVFFAMNARQYDLISLGDETALSMGVHTARLKKATMLAVAFVTGIVVSCCGLIGLVGFVVPHIVRLVLGPGHRKLMPMVFLSGSVFLVWMDILARMALAPQEMPIGIFIAACGGPFFVWLLYRQRDTKQG